MKKSAIEIAQHLREQYELGEQEELAMWRKAAKTWRAAWLISMATNIGWFVAWFVLR